MKPYLSALSKVSKLGNKREDRTGVGTISTFGLVMDFNLQKGFPLITTKKMHFAGILAELRGFLNGVSSAEAMRSFGTKIWDKDANENPQWLASAHRKGEDDLGRIYGTQWRSWVGAYQDPETGKWKIAMHDQLTQLVNDIIQNPHSRRHILTSWNPLEVHNNMMALPPCHMMAQFYVFEGNLDMIMYQRSADMFLGVPYNIASYSLFQSILAQMCGLRPRHFKHILGDAHIYLNHKDQVEEQLSRKPKELPMLLIDPGIQRFEGVTDETVKLHHYDPHPAIKAELNVGA